MLEDSAHLSDTIPQRVLNYMSGTLRERVQEQESEHACICFTLLLTVDIM